MQLKVRRELIAGTGESSMNTEKILTLMLLVLLTTTVACLGMAQEIDARRPIPAVDSVFIEELTWMEVRDAIKAGKTTAIVGTGGIEQNGPYVSTGKHNYVLQATTEAIARKLGAALVGPIVKFVPEGDIEPPTDHMRYPGTISLREETYKLLLTDICGSLRQHGFKDIILIGDSGGNQRGMKEVAEALNKRWGGGKTLIHYVSEYYEQDMWSFDYLKTIGVHQMPDIKSANRAGIHSDYHYEAIVATVDPKVIRTEQRIAAGKYSVNGFDMNPPSKTIENGKKLVEYRANITVDAIRKALAKRANKQPPG
jgi:creatinine amidohydrolase/Fe(II)-dependent formamide hydrolase-like protein